MNKNVDYLTAAASSIPKPFFENCSTALIGLSGGPDSFFLFLLMHRLQETYGFVLHAIHINHQLRAEASKSDEQFVRKLCREYDTPLKVVAVDVQSHAKDRKISIEMAARELRHTAFSEYAKAIGATHLATGHTADDRIETALMRLITGCGIEGLTGLRAMRTDKNITLVRPILSCWKQDIINWLEANSIRYRVDASNASDIFFRNKVRNHLIPLLAREYNPNFKTTLAHSLDLLEDTASAVDASMPHGSDLFLCRSDALYILSKKALLSYPAGIISTVLQRACFGVSDVPVRIGSTHIRQVTEHLRKSHFALFDFPNPLIVGCDGQFVYIGRSESMQRLISPEDFSFTFRPGSTLSFNQNCLSCTIKIDSIDPGNAPKQQHASPAAWELLCSGKEIVLSAIVKNFSSADFHVRLRHTGDSISTSCGTKKLKKLYIDAKVPALLRSILPVITQDDTLIWTPVTSSSSTPTTPHALLSLQISLKMNF